MEESLQTTGRMNRGMSGYEKPMFLICRRFSIASGDVFRSRIVKNFLSPAVSPVKRQHSYVKSQIDTNQFIGDDDTFMGSTKK